MYVRRLIHFVILVTFKKNMVFFRVPNYSYPYIERKILYQILRENYMITRLTFDDKETNKTYLRNI